MSALVPVEPEQSTRVLDPLEKHPPPYSQYPRVELIHCERIRKEQSFKMEDPPAVAPSDKQNFSLDYKPGPEYVSKV